MSKISTFFQRLEPYIQMLKWEWLLALSLILSVWLLARLSFNLKSKRRLMRIKKEKIKKKRRGIENWRYFSHLKETIDLYFKFKERRYLSKKIYSFILIFETGLLLTFLFIKVPLLAILFPLMIHYFSIEIFKRATFTFHDYIRETLPHVIKQTTKALTKTSDLKTVLYEASLRTEGLLKNQLLQASRRMTTENHDVVLLDIASDAEDTWLYAFSFLLIGYKSDSKKSHVIKNLNDLANMIEKENRVKEKSITDHRFLVVMNHVLLGIAFFGSMLSFLLNPISFEFFFRSIVGVVVLLIGVSAMLGTLLVNAMMKNPKG